MIGSLVAWFSTEASAEEWRSDDVRSALVSSLLARTYGDGVWEYSREHPDQPLKITGPLRAAAGYSGMIFSATRPDMFRLLSLSLISAMSGAEISTSLGPVRFKRLENDNSRNSYALVFSLPSRKSGYPPPRWGDKNTFGFRFFRPWIPLGGLYDEIKQSWGELRELSPALGKYRDPVFEIKSFRTRNSCVDGVRFVKGKVILAIEPGPAWLYLLPFLLVRGIGKNRSLGYGHLMINEKET